MKAPLDGAARGGPIDGEREDVPKAELASALREGELGDAHHAMTPVPKASDLDHEVERRREPLARRVDRRESACRREIRGSTLTEVAQGRRVRGCEDAVDAVPHGIDDLGHHVPRERTDDESIRPDADRGAHGVRSLFSGVADEDRDGVRLVEDEFVVLLQDDDPVVDSAGGGERAEHLRRAGVHRARHQDVRPARDGVREERRDRPGNSARTNEVVEAVRRFLRLAEHEHVRVAARRWKHAEHAAAPLEPSLDEHLVRLQRLACAFANTADHARDRLLARLIDLGLHGSDATTGPAVDYSAGRNELFAQLRAELEVRDRFAQWESAHRPRETDRRLDPTGSPDEQALVATLAVRWQHIDHAPQTFRHRPRWILNGVLLDPQSEQFLIRQSRERVTYRERIMGARSSTVT